ncbi:BREX-2 system adenine-specific DNA-methyltransferase PglX [Nocardia gipuzkoensis]|uniref:BREX-2 system adenine-specific DNA-methyltransferase PglX n=1 Tax=Nocardia gipuzkoensis TaxID=2749991 RepID=UPI00237ED940|nr:BREX-2 system adenine-specific DNA-methyltransferase PglX [Nocardia gipuzkoensis]MDE1675015.1 BREX-2 system adenine-specific DNA-methyltransferase PglX [Nocardia gipuzkoensis]
MIDVKALQGQVRRLVDDLRTQVASDRELDAKLRLEHARAKDAKRVGVSYETWLEGELDQAAVAWVLGCVFVRFCEDNRLVERVWIGGPEKHASAERAMEARQAYVIANPTRYEREWLREAFTHLKNQRATSKIFDEHNPVWRFDISGQAAEDLADFFRRGVGCRSLVSPGLDAHFLGELYQELSIYAQTTFALKQTPPFVEKFIIERTLGPALGDFGLSAMSVIDPTCGSGHFLLGAFEWLLAKWKEREPKTPIETLVDRALNQVTGVDINPFAVAIARFRLVIAALQETGRTNLNNTYPVRVAVGDSLLHWGDSGRFQGDLLASLEGREEFAYYSEDDDLLAEYLKSASYTAVVGNPPYILVKDPNLNERYRDEYSDVCYRQLTLSVPFAKRFFELARRGGHDGSGAGYVGQITANAFMKRDFGKQLITYYFAHEVELMDVIDTSGAFIPGHGIPTVILIGCNRAISSRYSGTIQVVSSLRGEPKEPEDPADGYVWKAILTQIDNPDSKSSWIHVSIVARGRLDGHPWNLGGGTAEDTMAKLSKKQVLDSKLTVVGYTGQTNADSAFLADARTMRRFGVEEAAHRQVIVGEAVRDFRIDESYHSLFPYNNSGLVRIVSFPGAYRRLWPMRTNLWARRTFGKKSYLEEGRSWWSWHQVALDRLRTPLAIALSEVATHNKFALDRDANLFNRTAPVIKLADNAPEEDHLAILGVLNSSTACFWMKQVSHDKGIRGEGGGFTSDDWERFYQFSISKLKNFPLPEDFPLTITRVIDGLSLEVASSRPGRIAAECAPTRERIARARAAYDAARAQMIAWQEELDWEVYRLYGLLDSDLTTQSPPPLSFGERAFEIVLARRMKAGELDSQWFARHGSSPITELPDDWTSEYKELVEKRIAVIESDLSIGLIERPEYKRRWVSESWASMQTAALRNWLLDRLEEPALWGSEPKPMSVAQLADRVRHDEEFRSVLDLWVGTDQHDLGKTLTKLIADDHVPFLPVQRYKASGLRNRSQWERTWKLQRREDSGESVTIDIPPKYGSADFIKPSYWRNRGKLDMPKERFISYLGLGLDDGDVFGWAGWDHLDQARALAWMYMDRKMQGGWPAERLLPLLAGLAELEPWLHQWFSEPKPGYPGSPAEFFSGLIDKELDTLGSDRRRLTELRGVEELA